jgi:hypothetical protein
MDDRYIVIGYDPEGGGELGGAAIPSKGLLVGKGAERHRFLQVIDIINYSL